MLGLVVMPFLTCQKHVGGHGRVGARARVLFRMKMVEENVDETEANYISEDSQEAQIFKVSTLLKSKKLGCFAPRSRLHSYVFSPRSWLQPSCNGNGIRRL